MRMSFAVGQRWISQAESELGLGTILQADARFVQVLFPAVDETRNYAVNQAPLMRVEFNPGDVLNTLEEFKFVVESVTEQHDTFVYHGYREDNGEQVSVKEIMLDHHIRMRSPDARLFTGNYDRSNWFSLRLEAHQHKAELESSPLLGLQGARVSLIPHQLYIANEVGQRFAPRVLLADEVGLGKTIEAGLIIHQQLISGRAQRVLIVVPESLQHQWLVEMLRRFNLRFSIFDDARCEDESSNTESPFDAEQQILVSQEWLSENGKWQQSLLYNQWDLVVVDEAHHVTPNKDEDSHQNQLYQHVLQIGKQTQGLVLLTATPDQLGHFGHFSRLNLLDPERFYDYEKFKQDESHYQAIAELANTILNHDALSNEHIDSLKIKLNDESSHGLIDAYNAEPQQNAMKLINALLDRHGTGRVMYRNSRQGVKGFPGRQVHGHPLTAPETYPSNNEFVGQYPELQHDSSISEQNAWWRIDPRVNWLTQFLKQHKGEKVLVICAKAETAIKLDDALFELEGLKSTIFHEGMTIVERDKAAAYFADEENSAQALICSEIGSEGRNFQFAHHLVLFDLPANPDLLEQRIGRLDRIGQTQTVQIHVPYLTESAQENLYQWYQQAFNAFEQTSTTARIVATEFKEQVNELLLGESSSDELNQFIELCRNRNDALKLEVENGRDRLLEINSSGGDAAKQVALQIEELDDRTDLMQFMERIWDQFGVQHEELGTFSKIIRPGEHMLNNHFPGLMEEGQTVCFDRDVALSNEDQQFLSWEHPMVTGVLDMLSTEELGNASVCLLPHKQLPAGTVLLELSYMVSTSAPKSLQLHRYLPDTSVRLMLDKNGNNIADKVKQGSLDKLLKNAKKTMAQQLIKALKEEVTVLLTKADAIAQAQSAAFIERAKQELTTKLTDELNRLVALREINPSIREEEVEFMQTRLEQSIAELQQAKVSLDAIRLIVVTQA
jgi:ATP-dependent helicase HepA